MFAQTAQMPSPNYQLYSNGSAGSGTSGEQANGGSLAAPAPRIQLLSNNVDNVNYYDDNSQVQAQRACSQYVT